MLEAIFLVSLGGQKSKLKLVLLKRLPGQIVFYFGLGLDFFIQLSQNLASVVWFGANSVATNIIMKNRFIRDSEFCGDKIWSFL